MPPNTIRPPTVAVFGGNHAPTAVAHRVAGLIAEARGVVLAGGDGRHRRGIKGQALEAASAAEAAWIGVPNGEGPPPSSSVLGRGLLLRAEIGDRRNLLEAWLCDAAVVFEGGLGTVSECVSSLCLGRPVLLVGRTWVEEGTEYVGLPMLFGEGAVPDEHLERLIEDTRTKLGAGGSGPLATEVSMVITRARLSADMSVCRHVEDPDDVAQILEEWVPQAARERLGHFPRGVGLDKLEPDHDAWWAELARTGGGTRPD